MKAIHENTALYTVAIEGQYPNLGNATSPVSPVRPWGLPGGYYDFKFEIKIPYAGGIAPGGSQVISFVYIRSLDNRYGTYLCAIIHDTRSEAIASIAHFDTSVEAATGIERCTLSQIVAEPLANASPYFEVQDGSMTATSSTFKETRLVNYRITKANVERLIRYLKYDAIAGTKARFAGALENADAYEITGWNINAEVFRPPVANVFSGEGWIGLSVHLIRIGVSSTNETTELLESGSLRRCQYRPALYDSFNFFFENTNWIASENSCHLKKIERVPSNLGASNCSFKATFCSSSRIVNSTCGCQFPQALGPTWRSVGSDCYHQPTGLYCQ